MKIPLSLDQEQKSILKDKTSNLFFWLLVVLVVVGVYGLLTGNAKLALPAAITYLASLVYDAVQKDNAPYSRRD